ncbi:hypothetical protein BDZ97DRAFT_364066 [Flammula alnicola]|nr:hypothetical protein BDZ97DRAFT_364066 [Flammula alnicola]
MGWFLLLTTNASVLLTAGDSLIMLRVYILYNCSWKMAVFLISLLVMQGMLIAIYTSRPLHLLPFGETCNILKIPREAAHIMAGVVVTQAISLLLTTTKRKVAFGESVVVHLVVRDGAWVFVLIVSLWVTIIPYFLFTQVAKPHIMLVKLLSRCELIDILILDMDIEFTSCIEMFENSQIYTAPAHPSRARGSTS